MRLNSILSKESDAAGFSCNPIFQSANPQIRNLQLGVFKTSNNISKVLWHYENQRFLTKHGMVINSDMVVGLKIAGYQQNMFAIVGKNYL